MTRFGVHVGLQHTHPDDLRAVWRRIEDLGFHWISVKIDGMSFSSLGRSASTKRRLSCASVLWTSMIRFVAPAASAR